VWKRLVEKQAEVFGARPMETREPEIEAAHQVPDLPEVIIPPVAPIPAVVTQLQMFDMSSQGVELHKTSHRSSRPATASDQLGLFAT
jgi:hypothetical protein